jgi:predicted ArsR family transcriptional regulator
MDELPPDEQSSRDPDAMLGALGAQYSAAILAAAGTPVSAQELSDRMGVPIATCYRRIEDLVEAGLLRREGRELSEQGRRTNVYRRTIDEVQVDLTESPVIPTLVERAEAEPGAQRE